MLPYWLFFLVPAFGAMIERPNLKFRPRLTFLWLVAWSVITVFVGLRYRVGADWGSYQVAFWTTSALSFRDVVTGNDPGYYALNWLVARAGYDIWLVNTICGGIFAYGLVAFARRQWLPWLALLIAAPYLVIVVAMGYTRQGVAIGFVMLALSTLDHRPPVRFVVWVMAAALFHKTAVLLIPIAILARARGRLWTSIWIGCIAVLMYQLFLSESVDDLLYTYVEREYNSQGAVIRIYMNAIPALLFIMYRNHFRISRDERNFWTYLSIVSLGFVALLNVSVSSTAVDRMALYFIPVQIYVLSRLPLVWQERYGGAIGQPTRLGLVCYSAMILFVWMSFAVNAKSWLPYRFYPLISG